MLVLEGFDLGAMAFTLPAIAESWHLKPVAFTAALTAGSIGLFLGSLLCGLSQDFGSFELLIIARAIQAIGGGGILPIATAEFGTSVPPEKRGMALGLNAVERVNVA